MRASRYFFPTLAVRFFNREFCELSEFIPYWLLPTGSYLLPTVSDTPVRVLASVVPPVVNRSTN
ncbi:MAG: hypothetical protein QME64_02155 [bacterium]|nr:hypothetical protein [bacterium]